MAHNSCSIVIPCYNHARFIERSIEGARAQSCPAREIIIVDDGSTDASIELLKSYQSAPDIGIILQDHQGAHAAINNGIAASRGDYIAILNSDDIYHAARIEKLLAIAEKAPETCFAFTKIAFIDEAGLSCTNCRPARRYSKLLQQADNDSFKNPFLHGNLAMSSSNYFFSRTLYEKAGPFRNLRYVHDWDWALRAAALTQPFFVDEPLLSYRVHPANTLREQDKWRHLLENAFLFASALLHGRIAVRGEDSYCNCLLKNDNFLPVLTLYFFTLLTSGTAEEALLDKIESGYFRDTLSTCFEANKLPIDILMSSNHLSRKLSLINKLWSIFKRLAPSLARHFTDTKTILPS